VNQEVSRSHKTDCLQYRLSALSNLWLAWQGHVWFLLLSNLIVYGAVVSSRQTLTQALLSDMVEPEFIDAGFSLYFLIGFISIPFWTVASGHGL